MKSKSNSGKAYRVHGAADVPKKERRKIGGGTITVRFVLLLLIVFGLITVISQLKNYLTKPLRTEIAHFYEDTDSVLFKGVFIRNEHQVVSDAFVSAANSGVIAYTNKCGSKLSINSVIAVVYPSEDEIFIRRKIADLKEQINILSEAGLYIGNTGNENDSNQDKTQINAFKGQLSDVHLRILRNIASANYEQAAGFKNEYLSIQSKINAVMGAESVVESYNQRITELEASLLNLEGMLSIKDESLQRLTVPDSGYFVNNADGYESVLDFKDSVNISRTQVEEIIAKPSLPVFDNVAGKVIDDYKWRMAGVLPTEITRTISVGSIVKLRVGAYPHVVSAVIINATAQDDGNTLYVFECELLNEEFVKKRVVSVRLLLEDYSGIRIPQSAVTFNYRWRMVANLDSKQAEKAEAILKKSLIDLKIDGDSNSSETVSALIVNSVKQEDGSVVIEIECKEFNEQLVKSGITSVTLSIENEDAPKTAKTEIKLPASAVTFKDVDERGVYIKNASVIVFRRINVLRSDEDFVVVENTKLPGYLKPYDEVVTKGENLHDGKIVD